MCFQIISKVEKWSGGGDMFLDSSRGRQRQDY